MTSARLFGNLAGGAARRPGLVLALALALGLGAAVLCAAPAADRRDEHVRLRAPAAPTAARSASTGTSAKSPSRCSCRGDLQQLVLSSDLERLVGLEGCLSGNVPVAAPDERGRPQRALRAARPRWARVKVVFGPGTFLNEAAPGSTTSSPG